MINKIAISTLNLYKSFLSNLIVILLGSRCRFEETCSEYSKRAIKEKGIITGSRLTLIRILKCQPFYNGSLLREEKF
jgi:uncharacterized protein